MHVSLTTALSSATEHAGSPVRAVVSEPLFSADHHLILPAGAHLDGSVTKVVPARRLHRNGQLRFAFRQVELGPGAPRAGFTTFRFVDNLQIERVEAHHAYVAGISLLSVLNSKISDCYIHHINDTQPLVNQIRQQPVLVGVLARSP